MERQLPQEDTPDAAAPNPKALKHEALYGPWWAVEYLPKRVKDPSKGFAPHWIVPRGRHRRVPENACIHQSVFQRTKLAPGYAPPNLPAAYDLVEEVDLVPASVLVPAASPAFDTGFDIAAGKQYCFSAIGKWIDKDPPAVDAGGVAHPGGIREWMNWLKRVPSAPWMALLGRMDGGPWFVIGLDQSPRTLPAGRLYCCANDVPGFYGNNQGCINLSIVEV